MRQGSRIVVVCIVFALALTGSSTAQKAPASKCLANDVTINGSGRLVGTPGRDVIVGSPGRDIIRGGGEADTICGRGGRDRIIGGAGIDGISGGAGRDLIVGDGATWTDKRAVGGDGDIIYGNAGADVIIGDAFSARGGTAVNRRRGPTSPDYIVGNNGRYDGGLVQGDLLIGGSVSRSGRVVGRDDFDRIKGAAGPDLIIGDNASLRGGPHPVGLGTRDDLSGGRADDDLVGGDGRDDCFGRGGLDAFTSCETHRPACPRGAYDGIRPENLIGAQLERARHNARRFDRCSIRVLERNGEPLPATDDFSVSRINVAVRNGRITRILGVF